MAALYEGGFGMRRRARLAHVSVLGALALMFFTVSSTSAASSYKPDGWVRYFDYYGESWPGDGHNPYIQPGSWKGKDIYNTTAVSQTAKTKTYPPSPGYWGYDRFDVTVQNDGAPSRFKVHGAAKFTGFKAYYFAGTTNITHAVESGSYTTPQLAGGATLSITVKVDVGDGNFPGETGW